MPVKDADGRVIGEVIDQSQDERGMSFTMRIDDPYYQKFLRGN